MPVPWVASVSPPKRKGAPHSWVMMGQMCALHSTAAGSLLEVAAAEDVLPQLMRLSEILWEGIAELLVMLGFDAWGGLHSCEQCSF